MTLIMRKMAQPSLVQAVKKVAEEIYSQGGYIRNMKSLGTRTLPNIKYAKGLKHTEGTYLLLDVDVRTSDLDKLGDEYRRDGDIIHQRFFSKVEEEFNCAGTLDDEQKSPAERPSVQKLIEQGRRPPKFKKIFDSKTGLDYYPFHR